MRKTEGKRRRVTEDEAVLDGITDSRTEFGAKLREMQTDRVAWHAACHGLQSQT